MKIMYDSEWGVVSLLGLTYAQWDALCKSLAGSRLDLVSHTRWLRVSKRINIVMLNRDEVTLISAVLVDHLRTLNDLVEITDVAIEMGIKYAEETK
jgi:hypothetical protein